MIGLESVTLRSSGGKEFRITVDDSGALDATDMETGESAAVGGGGGIVITESYDAVNSKVVYTCNVSNEALMAALETGAPVALKFVVDEMGIDAMANVICAYKRDDIWVARFMYASGFNDLEKIVITISSDGIEQYME